MELQKLLEGIEVLQTNADLEMDITGVCYSSRTVTPGAMFVAIPGFATDGHRFIPDAVRRGATVVLCERELPEDCPWVQVASSREALAKLGENWYNKPSKAMKVVGVTGTNGKTSTTYLLKSLLEYAIGAKVGLVGTICNMIGDQELYTERTTPESFELQGLLAQMRDAGCTHVVMEVSSHALALHRVDGIDFAVGAFTNLTEDHLDFHHTMEEYGQAKARLFRVCRRGVFDIDDAWAPKMMATATCDCRTVGLNPNAQLRGENVVLESDHIEMDVCEGTQRAHLRLSIPGRFTVSNALAALGLARSLDVPLEDAVAALSKSRGVKGRIEVVPTPGTPYTVLIDYAHTPDGLENVLRSVRDFCKGRILVVFGCGGDRDRTKRPIMGNIGVKYADLAIITSDNPRTEEPMAIIEDILAGVAGTQTPYFVEENRRKAIRMAMSMARKDDIIVLAGKGHETYQIIGTEKTHLDEREEVASALWELSH